MTTTRWEYSKALSNYHFDPRINEDSNPPFKVLGRVSGPLEEELNRLLKSEPQEANTFTNRLRVQGVGDDEVYTKEMDLAELRYCGLPEDHSFFYNMQIKNSPLFIAIGRSFGMEPWGASVHIQRPGQVFPYHIDEIPGLKNNEADHWLDREPDRAARFEVQLLDWTPGHVWAYGNTYWKQWRAGDIGYHNWRHIPHGTANISRSIRATLQITGFVTENTRKIIEHGYSA